MALLNIKEAGLKQ